MHAFLNATSLEDGNSLAELCHPSLVSIQHVAEGEAPEAASGVQSPFLQNQGPEPGYSATSPTAGQQGKGACRPSLGAREDQGVFHLL